MPFFNLFGIFLWDMNVHDFVQYWISWMPWRSSMHLMILMPKKALSLSAMHFSAVQSLKTLYHIVSYCIHLHWIENWKAVECVVSSFGNCCTSCISSLLHMNLHRTLYWRQLHFGTPGGNLVLRNLVWKLIVGYSEQGILEVLFATH